MLSTVIQFIFFCQQIYAENSPKTTPIAIIDFWNVLFLQTQFKIQLLRHLIQVEFDFCDFLILRYEILVET